MENLKLEHWEGDEYIIEFKGKPVGCTLTKANGTAILHWLKNYLKYLIEDKSQ